MESPNATGVNDGPANASQIACPIDSDESPCATYVNYATLPMLLVVILLSLLVKRNTLYPGCCNGRPGILVPVNLVKETKARMAFTAAFVILTSRLHALILDDQYWAEQMFNDPEFNNRYGFLKVFIKMINSVQLSICFYPLFACIGLRKYALVNVLGILNLTPWMYFTVRAFVGCNFRTSINNHGETVGNIGPHMALVSAIPEFLADIFLLVFFIVHFIKYFRWKTSPCSCILISQQFKTDAKQTNESVYMKYVRALLKRRKPPPPKGFLAKIKESLTYRTVPGLKTSPRVLITIIVAGTICLECACRITAVAYKNQPTIYKLMDLLEGKFHTETGELSRLVYDGVNLLYVGLYLCNALALSTQIFSLWRVYVNYRRDLRRVYAGEKRILEYVSMSHADLLVCSSRYAGYQIVFTLYSYTVFLLVLFAVIVVVLGFMTVLPIKYHLTSPVLVLIKAHWKTVLISLVIYYIQILLAKFVFYRNGSFDNRRLYHVTDYFLFFFNALLSIFTSLKRLLVSAVIGMLYLARLDQCGVIRGFELFDSGHKAYLGMLYLETHQNNPIAHAFIDILRHNVPAYEPRIVLNHDELSRNTKWRENQKSSQEKRLHSRQMQMKWLKLITLANNPVLVLEQMSKTMIKVVHDAEHAKRLDREGDEEVEDRNHLPYDTQKAVAEDGEIPEGTPNEARVEHSALVAQAGATPEAAQEIDTAKQTIFPNQDECQVNIR